MDYGRVVSQGWKITWENKYLWVLGFFAALTSSRANSSSYNFSSSEMDPGMFSPEQMAALGGAFIAIVCFASLLGLIFIIIGLMARGGLITAVYKISVGKEMTLGQAFSAGRAKIWPILGMNILLYIPFILMGVIIFVAVLMMFGAALGTAVSYETLMLEQLDPAALESVFAGFGLLFVCMMLLCCVLMILGIALNFINAFAYRGIMIQNMGVMESISHSWQLIRQNFGEVMILSILFLFIGIGYGILTGLVLVPVALVGMAPLFGGMISGEITTVGMVYGLGFGLCLGFIGALLMSILVTWQSATFTLAYKEWVSKMGFLPAEEIVEKA
jgi:hypothetical protein